MGKFSPRSRVFSWKVASTVTAGVVAAAFAVTVGGSTAAADTPPPCSDGTTVQTADGPVCGVVANGVVSYRGIRYAAAPVGNLRWASPKPVTPWTSTFEATTEGAVCPQVSGLVAGGSTNEDCLNLKVQIPAGTKAGDKLPVMVEIHGGGFLLGSPAEGVHLATAGHVVYVAMNYRLGIFGFMANHGLGDHSGDYGLQDQQASLRWVQRNIAKFGGDPRNVTIFGQSAGGASVCAAAVSPSAAGLFQKGISQSGFYNAVTGPQQVWEKADCKSQWPTEAEAQQAGATFAAKVGCGSAADQVACLRAVPVATLLSNAGQVQQADAGGTIAPTVNGSTIPQSPALAFQRGNINNVSLMIGADRDEINGGVPTPAPTTPADYVTDIQKQYGSLASAVMARYPLDNFPDSSPFIAYRTAVADSDSVCPALTSFGVLDKHIKTYAWEGDNADNPRLNETTPLGSYHVAENPFIFPNGTLTFDPNQAAFGDQLTAQWAGYARTGSPAVAGTPRWPAYTHHNEQVMSLVPAGDSAMVPSDVMRDQHNCDFWDSVTPKVHS